MDDGKVLSTSEIEVRLKAERALRDFVIRSKATLLPNGNEERKPKWTTSKYETQPVPFYKRPDEEEEVNVITPSSFCTYYGDFWSDYDRAPGAGNYFRHYCMRHIEFDFDIDTSSISSFAAYRVFGVAGGGRPPDGIQCGDTSHGGAVTFPFTIGGAAVANLLALLTFSPALPASGSVHLTMRLEMFREVKVNVTSPGPPITYGRPWLLVQDTEADSVPFVGCVCYTPI